MCFVFIWEQTATCATYSINWLVFITEMKSVYSAVLTGFLNKAVCASSLKGLNNLYQIWHCALNKINFSIHPSVDLKRTKQISSFLVRLTFICTHISRETQLMINGTKFGSLDFERKVTKLYQPWNVFTCLSTLETFKYRIAFTLNSSTAQLFKTNTLL